MLLSTKNIQTGYTGLCAYSYELEAQTNDWLPSRRADVGKLPKGKDTSNLEIESAFYKEDL